MATTLDALMKSNLEWKKWGERDPLYAVSTSKGKERGGPDAWTDEDFYELGASDWRDFYRHWQHFGVKCGHCVEIGCGAGRMTKQLAGAFERVTATDVSQHQLDYASRLVEATNVDFQLTDGLVLPLADGSCDAAFSAHVFQHFESIADALAVFRELHRVLRPGGSMFVHVPLYELPDLSMSRGFRAALAAFKTASDLRATLGRRSLKSGKWRFVMRRLRFERSLLLEDLADIGFSELEVRTFRVRSNGSVHDVVFASK